MTQISSTELNDAVVLVLAAMAVVIGVLTIRLISEATRALATYNANRGPDRYPPYGSYARTGSGPRSQNGHLPQTGAMNVAAVPPENPHAPPTPALGVPRQGVTRPFKPPSAP
ncbi:MAG: hypothetical protein JWP85_2254 [Rhodoglobus sp.]|nr:hypothetical protein [Rhodoglobus sp.]